MKKFKFLTLGLLAMTGFAFTSCSDSDDGPKSFDTTIAVAAPTGDEAVAASDIENLTITLTDARGASQTIENFDPTKPQTLSLKRGTYTISAKGKVKGEATAFVTGAATLTVAGVSSANIALSKVYESSIIFKEIFTTAGKLYYMVDSYYEIVNNSDETQYLDGLMLVAHGFSNSVASAWQESGEYVGIYPSAQGAAVAFPGKVGEKNIPLEPGQVVTIANNAANHFELAGPNEDGTDNVCPDLNNADWEIFLDNGYDIDYETDNLNVVFTNNKYLRAFGLAPMSGSWTIVKLPEGTDPIEWAADEANQAMEPNSPISTTYLLVPSKYVLDAVEMTNRGIEEYVPKFLAKDDAQGIEASAAYGAEGWGCIRRKVANTAVAGRTYYQDTNNSSVDFENSQPIDPRYVAK